MFIININKYVAEPCVGLCAGHPHPLPQAPSLPTDTTNNTHKTPIHVIYMRIQIVIYFIYILQLNPIGILDNAPPANFQKYNNKTQKKKKKKL